MTVVADPGAAHVSQRDVVHEIAARRLADVRLEASGLSPADLRAVVRSAPSPRPIAERLAAPGLHLIAEIKRASPSAGRIAVAGEDIIARARAYETGGAAAISVLCEPHWFGGSVQDLRAVRAAVAIPVLAKDFVVDAIQLPLLRAAGADIVLLLAVLHPARRLARLVAAAHDLGLEALVEVHDARELDRALATTARLIGLNNRDLRTLEVDVERAGRLRELVPDDRLVIAESGVRSAAIVARWRALGFDGVLVGEALVRSDDPAAAVRAFVAAGAAPTDAANVARRPLVKICGITDEAGVLAAIAAGADAIGLNVVADTPRALALDEAATLARLVRAVGGAHRPLIVAITADASPRLLAAVLESFDPDIVQLNGNEPIERAGTIGRRTWKVLHLPAAEPGDLSTAAANLVSRGRAYLAGGVEGLLLDTAGGPHPGGTGTRAAERLAAAVAREVPVTLAGGLHPANVAAALRTIAANGVDVASGTERPRVAGERPTKDPFRVALFVKRARAARDDRPTISFGPTPVHPGLIDADGAGRWGMERDFGGRYVPETLMAALQQLSKDTSKYPSQGKATTYDLLNVHTEPNRLSPSYLQVQAGERVDVIGRKLTPKLAPARKPLVIAAPKPPRRAREKKKDKSTRILPPTAPDAPKPPPDWMQLSKERLPAAETEPAPAKEAEPEVPPDDWTLIRNDQGQSGWVMTRRIYMAIPDEVAQYAEGKRISFYFSLGKISDDGQNKDIWLWTTIDSGVHPYDFDSFRVFVWSTNHHRYETGYIQRRLEGYFPVRAGEGKFSVVVAKEDGRRYRISYSMLGNRVKPEGEKVE